MLLVMKKEARLASIIKEIDFGEFSRNKHFDAYRDPLVGDARARLSRVHALADLLGSDSAAAWDIKLSPERDRHGLWTLTCRNRRLEGRWVAKLRDFELEMLRHYSRSEVIRS